MEMEMSSMGVEYAIQPYPYPNSTIALAVALLLFSHLRSPSPTMHDEQFTFLQTRVHYSSVIQAQP
jgi:hypothetical protein